MSKNFMTPARFTCIAMQVSAFTTLLAATTAHAGAVVHTTTTSRQVVAEPRGPFEASYSQDDVAEMRVYTAEIPLQQPGRLLTASQGKSKRSDVAEFGHSGINSSSETSYSNTQTEPANSFPDVAIGGDSLGANVTEAGAASIQAKYKSFSFGDGQSNFGSTAIAGWSDSWLIPANGDHALGTAGRLRLTLNLDGLYATNRIVPAEDLTFPGVKFANAIAQIGTSSLSVDSVWTTDPQHQTSSAYIDFIYGQSFDAKFDLTSSTLRLAGLIELTATESFGAEISEVLIPLDTTLTHTFGSFRVANSSDANLYPGAPVPEPATLALMLAGLGALGFATRRRTR